MPTELSIINKIEKEGQYISFFRTLPTGEQRAMVKAFVRGYTENPLGNPNEGYVEGDRVLHVAVRSLKLAGWNEKPAKPDEVEIDGDRTVVQSSETRSLRGKPVEYIIRVLGS